MELNLYKFNYEFDEDKLMEEAKGTGYVPFTDVGNQTTKQFKEWMSENPHMRDKVIDFYRKMNSRTEVKESWNCPYAISIENYFAELTGFEVVSRFYLQKSGFKLPLHTDKGTECSINMLLGEGHDPIKFKGHAEYYKTALLNVQELHGVDTTQDRYLFKVSFKNNTFEEVKSVLSSKLSSKQKTIT